jgi:phage regulator Rha-like protein
MIFKEKEKMTTELIPIQIIENKIFVIRGHKVMIDRDLAELYEVQTKRLNEAVKRNIKRFPVEFIFQLNDNEKNELVANCDRFKILIHSTSNPYAFTEHGVVMLASVLNSDRAIAINVQVVKAFVKLREMALTNAEFSKQLKELESTFINYAKQNNADIGEIFQQLEYLTEITKPNQIGF